MPLVCKEVSRTFNLKLLGRQSGRMPDHSFHKSGRQNANDAIPRRPCRRAGIVRKAQEASGMQRRRRFFFMRTRMESPEIARKRLDIAKTASLRRQSRADKHQTQE